MTELKYLGYDKRPTISIPNSAGQCVVGWDAIADQLRRKIADCSEIPVVVAVECYPGVHVKDVVEGLGARLQGIEIIQAEEAMHSSEVVEVMASPYTGGDDPTFGYLAPLTLPDWFDPDAVAKVRRRIASPSAPITLVVGCGATYLTDADIVVYASLSRWEAQNRFRRNETGNLGIGNATVAASEQYKHAYFVDWRIGDRWKQSVLPSCDFVIDANDPRRYKMAAGDVVRRAYRHTVERPFRVVPFFDPAPWGGQWMKDVCDLDRDVVNFGWCFDCVPEENSVLFDLGGVDFELPANDLTLFHPQELLGAQVFEKFGAEFPIRFDFLDTMDGGNLSFQVHPLTEYIQQNFGMHYTQDESYYILDAGEDACVYLGLREGVDPAAMKRDLRKAQTGRAAFPADDYACKWPARKHDHFLIPAGTCHCSGRNAMVLEISATPYIFTFKMWDWDRLGLDGKPRPIHLEHALANLQWDRDESWVREQLINQFQPLAETDDWREERTGLHD
ncbi:MAG: class I mannose-6-phosphate isomerase, partial [Planctomycetales bacterium]|nr:class I mannose-6-phosphate isomerase [Planctomycetales bacterium]